ncbi:frequency clock protein [Apiospora aurea]|uniref:Frequency clock protein n=1 Tax=Apiospora aurea TaxID=335848 RepID=A0ABR1PUA2_9PEZI
MADPKNISAGSQPPPSLQVTYKNPKRTSPENSITLRHHRMAREASKRPSPPGNDADAPPHKSPRRHSSNESHQTGTSDPTRWFDQSNKHPAAAFDSSMDVDPPFFQRESDESNEEGTKYPVPSQSPAYRFVQNRNLANSIRPGLTHHSSSADDYRSVIDDLTIENRRLRDELKRYKQMGPDSLRREKLFEVKVHGLPSRRKRELEAALRDFTTSLDGSSAGDSSHRKVQKAKGKGLNSSKHASSSSGSNSRPGALHADSAYASMSTGQSSTGQSLPGRLGRQSSDQTIEKYLHDVPEGLWPRSSIVTEKEKKKLVVRRLEQIFTGKGLGNPQQPLPVPTVPPVITEGVEMPAAEDKSLTAPGASREAQILPRGGEKEGRSRSRGNGSASNSNEDQMDSRDNGSCHGGSHDVSPPGESTPEQRATMPRDLDPDRPQNPSENMDYIRHLGLAAPQKKQYSAKDVAPDAEGWVYLNLLCNLAQLHIFNVTPDFIRSAVSERSEKFQLSPDGRKIRWRGGEFGTKFSSESSGDNSQRGNSSDDTDVDGSNGQDQRKKQKTQASAGNDVITSEPSKFGPQLSNSSADSFHYKPLFVHQQSSSSDEQPSLVGDDSESSYDRPEQSHLGITSKWNNSGVSGLSQRKRRRDGAIIYYTGAPFCTDLSGDIGESSPNSTDSSLEVFTSPRVDIMGPGFKRTPSGSSIPFKPLSSLVSHHAMMDLDFVPPGLSPDEEEEPEDMQVYFPWSDSTQSARLVNFEASGLGGITPDDHFVVVVETHRPKKPQSDCSASRSQQSSDGSIETKDMADSVAARLAAMSTRSPLLRPELAKQRAAKLGIKYVAGNLRRLPPVPLPPATFFFGSSDSVSDSEESGSGSESSNIAPSSRRPYARSRARRSTVKDGGATASDDDDEDESDDEAGFGETGDSSPDQVDDPPALQRSRPSNTSKITTGSSVATAGGAVSHGYSSAGEA